MCVCGVVRCVWCGEVCVCIWLCVRSTQFFDPLACCAAVQSHAHLYLFLIDSIFKAYLACILR